MNGGVKSALLISCAVIAGCSTTNVATKVRPIGDPAVTLPPGGDAIAVARGQFRLGNVGLALEAFRRAQRDNPNDPAALSGIGDCYAAMGRYDIAETSYEVALSLAPRDPVLLLGLASVFERSGQAQRAADIRAEAARFQQAKALVAAARAAQAAAQKPAPAVAMRQPAHAKPASSITVDLPPARPAKPAPVAASRVERTPVHPEAAQLAQTSGRTPIAPATPAPLLAKTVAHAATVPSTTQLPPRALVQATAMPLHAATSDLPMGPAIQASVDRPQVDVRSPVKTLATIQPAPAPAPAQALPTPRAPISVAAVPPQVPAPALALEQPVHVAAAAARPSELTLPPTEPVPVTAATLQHVALPALALQDAPPVAPAAPVPFKNPAPSPLPTPPREAIGPKEAQASPRLERISGREVALVTVTVPTWRAPPPASRSGVRAVPLPVRTASADRVRWLPLGSSSGSPNVQVLNAARAQGLAASARTVLVDRGWRKIAIGNAPATLHNSVVLYPKNRAALGKNLAAQFGVKARMADRKTVVLILGRDSVGRIGSRRV